jgi:choline dehydrogenase
MGQLKFDYIIVGSGSAGAVVANRLSADPNVRVLLLEAGPPDEYEDVRNVTGFTKLWGSDLDWKIMTTEQPGLNGRALMITQGNLLGGSTQLHAMMYVRGCHLDYDQWCASGADGWSYQDVLPHLKAIENYDGGASEYRGVGGGLHVRTGYDPNSVSEPFLNAAVELGFEGPHSDYNGPRNENMVGPLQFSITPEGRRGSSVESFLRPVSARTNLVIETNAPVSKVLFEGKRAVGVAYTQNGQPQQARAEREVIISAGAFFSPQLLLLSGIGPADHLKEHDIPVLVDLPGVGQNLQDHMQLPVIYGSKIAVPTTETLCGNILFTRTRPGMDTASPDLQVIFSPTVPGPLAAAMQFPNPVCIFVNILVRPFSRGEVRLRSANPQDLPLVNPNYLQADADVQTLVSAVKLCRELAATSAFATVNDGEIAPGEGTDLVEYVRSQAATLWHPAGTCKMGRDRLAVVDPQLRVYGVEGLRVVDASVMPTVTAGNTNAPTAMIGDKVAGMIRERTT